MDCLFCKIINHEIPNYTIYEDDQVLAFLDISQATKGHTLVVPKKHSDDITFASKEDLEHLIIVAQKIAQRMLKTLPGIIGVNIINNCKEGAGQAILHTHIHVIPRYKGDDLVIKNVDHSNQVDLAALAKTLKF
ncbi:MAG: HIT family protein [Bacilli bacterium]|nr:HIT family protein [Bacilli bacterium]MDD3422192.1 HIT family protein [Bacilli bacterium]